MTIQPLVLMILDGFGFSKSRVGNAITAAKTPILDEIKKNYPFSLLQAAGKAVGLPWNEVGNSEAGHLTIGAGRIVKQYHTLISEGIEDGSFFKNEALSRISEHLKKYGGRLHILGILTSGSVHAHLKYPLSLLEWASENKIENTYLHLFTDGKDSRMKESEKLLDAIYKKIESLKTGRVATIIGRNFAMDRNEAWPLTKTAYDLLTQGKGEIADNLRDKIRDYHSDNITDDKIPPIITKEAIENKYLISDNDAVLFFNFRKDSARQLVEAFIEKDFDFFDRKTSNNILFVTMAKFEEYKDYDNVHHLYEIKPIINNLAEIIDKNGYRHLHLAESEKYAHVTYFFNGLREKPYKNETDVFIKSGEKKEEAPELQAEKITKKTIEEIKAGLSKLIVINFANPDILAHTGNFEATVKGIEIMDKSVEKIKKSCFENNYALIITSDHGHAESLTYLGGTGEKQTKHQNSPVPFYLVLKNLAKEKTNEEIKKEEIEINGLLSDVAPTILEIMGISQPPEMTGKSLMLYI